MRHVDYLLRNTVRLVRATNFGNSIVTLYKVPGTPSMRSTYTVESFDYKGNPIERYSFRYIRRQSDANKFYNWVIMLAS